MSKKKVCEMVMLTVFCDGHRTTKLGDMQDLDVCPVRGMMLDENGRLTVELARLVLCVVSSMSWDSCSNPSDKVHDTKSVQIPDV